MKRKPIIIAFLCTLLVMNIHHVTTEEVQTLSPSESGILGSAYVKSPKTTVAGSPDAQVFVVISKKIFYKAWITNFESKIQIRILNEKANFFNKEFKKDNQLIFIDAVQNIILVKEVSQTREIIKYWVIKIIYDFVKGQFHLKCFSVNPRVASNFFVTPKDYQITKIIEYDVNKQWIAVIDKNKVQLDVYKINIKQELNTLISVSWLYLEDLKIKGGNSRVLYDQTYDQFLIDPQVCKQNQDLPTAFEKVPVCELTKLKLYGKQCTKIIDLIGWNFQYLTENKEKTCATTFLYRGYGDLKIKGNRHLVSKQQIKLITDEYNFFILISDCDLYVTRVEWSKSQHKYRYFAGLLSEKVADAAEREKIFKAWSKIDIIVFIKGKFFFIANGWFYVYGTKSTPFKQIYRVAVSSSGSLEEKLFKQIKKYYEIIVAPYP